MNEAEIELAANRAAYCGLSREKTPEQCVHCDADVLFVDETECWFSRDTGYECPAQAGGQYSVREHNV